MDGTDLNVAREALRAREGITAKNWAVSIGSWCPDNSEPHLISGLPAWASAHGIDAVIWTGLKPKFAQSIMTRKRQPKKKS